MIGTRLIGTAAVAALIAGALVSAPAQAAKACGKYKPAEPVTDSQNSAEALKAKVVKVTQKHTEAKPLVIEYDHGPAMWWPQDPANPDQQSAIVEDTKWFNIQVDTTAKYSGLSIRQQWSETSPDDMDLYLYDKSGGPIGSSAEYNYIAGSGVVGSGNGGMGFEQVLGMGVSDCQGVTIESRAFTTPGQSMQLIIWVGSIL